MAILANNDAASATGNSGGEAASGGGGNADGADAERDAENEDGVVMSWQELLIINKSLSDFENATWLELETLCQSRVRDEIDVAIEVVIEKQTKRLLKQKTWEWVKLAHKGIYDAMPEDCKSRIEDMI
jgi:hypothetical protein